MLFGCCTSNVDDAAAAVAGGADFIEVGLSGVMAMSDEGFSAWGVGLAAREVAVRAANGFMPAEIKVVGPEVDQGRVEAYLATAGQRLERLGVKVAVFGSSGSRQIPEGFDPARAREQFAAFLGTAADRLAPHGVALAVEPLCAAESNLVNTVADAISLVRSACPQARVLADCFHMMRESEPLDVLAQAGDLLVHTHVSNARRRGPGAADTDVAAFVRELRRIDYAGGCSLECGWDDFPHQIGGGIGTLRGWAA